MKVNRGHVEGKREQEDGEFSRIYTGAVLGG
jgi:hypothetical protein